MTPKDTLSRRAKHEHLRTDRPELHLAVESELGRYLSAALPRDWSVNGTEWNDIEWYHTIDSKSDEIQ